MKKLTDKDLLEDLKKRMEEKDLALKQLEDTTQELRDVNKKLQESEALKSNFISNITNEIVNPFTSVLGLAKTILNMEGKQNGRIISMVKMIYLEAFSLDFQLKNIFAAAEIESGETFVSHAWIDVNSIIHSVVDKFQENAQKKEIRINTDVQPGKEEGKESNFVTDPQKLQLILSNLIDNAIKFSSATGQINVTARIQEDGALRLIVEDHGSGIAKEDQVTIYDRFSKADHGINDANRGHGLGLSIIKALVEILNGKITMKSQLHHGSVFTIIIPRGVINEETDGFSMDGNDIFFEEETF